MVENYSLEHHLDEVKKEKRRFENVFQSVSRMILDRPDAFEKKIVNGKTTYDFNVFRQGDKHIIGMYDELNSFVSFVKDAAEGGSSKEMAYVLVGEPGNGKTFLVDYLSSAYRNFISQEGNKRYTFRFQNLDKLNNKYGKITEIESQTFEDPMILALNLHGNREAGLEALEKQNFANKQIEKIDKNFRPLGACSDYILDDIREYCDGDVQKMLEFIKIVPIPISETRGTLTGKYAARDKITSSAKDLLGEESVQRILHIKDTSNPYRIDLRIGALARVAGGGIHFSDELFKNKKDLVQVYLGVIQNRFIEMDGFKWPLDTLIIATSNNNELNRFLSEKEEAPILDRCRMCFMPHNTNYLLQKDLTEYAIGSADKTTFAHKPLHIDPNLNYATSVATILTRLPKSDKLTSVEMMKLTAGEIAGEKSVKTLVEIIDNLKRETDVSKRFGQVGIGHRGMSRALQIQMESSETQEGECMFAKDIFRSLEQIVYDEVSDSSSRAKYLKDLDIAKGLYREQISKTLFNAFMDDPLAIEKDVMNYVNMVIGIDAENLGPDKMWRYKDPQTKEPKSIKIDESFIKSVEGRLGLNRKETQDSFRQTISKIYGQKVQNDENYNFMDNQSLVKAVVDVRLESDILGAASLAGALANRTNEENQKLYNKVLDVMVKKLGHCSTCAQKTIEYFCEKKDQE